MGLCIRVLRIRHDAECRVPRPRSAVQGPLVLQGVYLFIDPHTLPSSAWSHWPSALTINYSLALALYHCRALSSLAWVIWRDPRINCRLHNPLPSAQPASSGRGTPWLSSRRTTDSFPWMSLWPSRPLPSWSGLTCSTGIRSRSWRRRWQQRQDRRLQWQCPRRWSRRSREQGCGLGLLILNGADIIELGFWLSPLWTRRRVPGRRKGSSRRVQRYLL